MYLSVMSSDGGREIYRKKRLEICTKNCIRAVESEQSVHGL